MKKIDVAVVGGGPAGLAAAIELARAGLSVHLFEKRAEIPDKACGEGVMPEGAKWLGARGIVPLIDSEWAWPFAGIRYVQDGRTCAEARFRNGSGLSVRRTALVAALQQAALDAGAKVDHGVTVQLIEQNAEAARIDAGGEQFDASLVVAADGLSSKWRDNLKLEGAPPKVRRFGQRRHFRGIDTAEFVEVHWSDGVEAYLTPFSDGKCGVAFLWEATDDKARFDDLMNRFPVLRDRFANAEVLTDVRGAGPLARNAKGVVSGRVVLIGDAAGYVDAITGEGMMLAFASATELANVAPDAIGGNLAALSGYSRAHAKLFRKYALFASSLVWLSRRPALRRQAFAALRVFPSVFENALALVG